MRSDILSELKLCHLFCTEMTTNVQILLLISAVLFGFCIISAFSIVFTAQTCMLIVLIYQ